MASSYLDGNHEENQFCTCVLGYQSLHALTNEIPALDKNLLAYYNSSQCPRSFILFEKREDKF